MMTSREQEQRDKNKRKAPTSDTSTVVTTGMPGKKPHLTPSLSLVSLEKKPQKEEKIEVPVKNKMNTIQVNEEIEPKICKITTDYGQGTGFFVNDESGLLLTSFHLAGAIQPFRRTL